MMDRDDRTDLGRIIDEAIIWHVASADDAMDWDVFTFWLEADPRHRACYQDIARMDATLLDHRDAIRAALAEHQAPTRSFPGRRARLSAWALVAAAAVAIGFMWFPGREVPQARVYATAANAMPVKLADGSTIDLAPRSRLTISGRDERDLALEGGAYFTIRHDPARPLAITAGPVTVHDIGTSFDIQSDPENARVEVAEGHVRVDARSMDTPAPLQAGQSLRFDGQAGQVLIETVGISPMGGWRHHQLNYNSVPLALVVGDLNRYAGVHVTVPGDLEHMRFSGSLVTVDGNRAVRDLAQLMGLEVVRGPHGDRLVAPVSQRPARD